MNADRAFIGKALKVLMNADRAFVGSEGKDNSGSGESLGRGR